LQRNDGTVAVQLLRNVILRITLGFAAFGPSWGCNNFSSLKQNNYSSYSVLVLEFFFLFRSRSHERQPIIFVLVLFFVHENITAVNAVLATLRLRK
jgi:hypothetical protein